jgi:uncharacterized protein YjiS (DUF1127 family)
MQNAITVAGTHSRGRITWRAKALTQPLVLIWMQFVGWQARRATRLVLNALDGRALQDIGLSRCEIDTVLRNIEWRNLYRHM